MHKQPVARCKHTLVMFARNHIQKIISSSLQCLPEANLNVQTTTTKTMFWIAETGGWLTHDGKLTVRLFNIRNMIEEPLSKKAKQQPACS